MLEEAGDRIDSIAIHRYAHAPQDYPFENYMTFGENLNEHLHAYEGIIRAVSLERGIKHMIDITVDEWIASRMRGSPRRDNPINVVVDEHGVSHLIETSKNIRRFDDKMVSTLEDALVTALFMNAFIRHAHSVRMTNFCIPLPMSMGLSSLHPDRLLLLPAIFYPFELYSLTSGQLALDVFCNCDTFSGTYLGRAYNGIRILDVAATLDETRKQLVVFVVNQSENKALETHITLATGEFAGNVRVAVINGPDIKAENTEEKPNQVVTRESVIRATGKSLTFTFEPHSVTALACSVR
jgi:alpha-N-arabinofuranosidase